MIIRKYLNVYFEKNFIKIYISFITIPILLTYKSKKDIYIYIDYRDLNNVIIKNRYLIPLIYKTFDILYYIKIYTKFNIITTFNYLYIAPGNKWKTAFIIRFKLFEYLITNFDIINTPNSFQYYINHIFFNFFDKFYTIYLNNILIYSKL